LRRKELVRWTSLKTNSLQVLPAAWLEKLGEVASSALPSPGTLVPGDGNAEEKNKEGLYQVQLHPVSYPVSQQCH